MIKWRDAHAARENKRAAAMTETRKQQEEGNAKTTDKWSKQEGRICTRATKRDAHAAGSNLGHKKGKQQAQARVTNKRERDTLKGETTKGVALNS
jgi:hypothetical protein